MKRNNIYKILAAAALIGFSSCSKDFLDKQPSEHTSPDQLDELAKQDPTVLNGYMLGIYAKMYEVGSGGTTGHDDFGQKGYDIFSDMLTGDMALGGDNYGWYTDIANLTSTRNYTANPGYMPWRYYYSIIYAANTLIKTLGGNEAKPSEKTKIHLLGQAKAMRAYAYFYLAHFYSRSGYGNGSEKILPIYIEPIESNAPKSTSKEVYDLMEDDLREAIELLSDFSRTGKHQVDASVAKGLLAYVLAARGTQEDLNEVVTITDELMNLPDVSITKKVEIAATFTDAGKLANPQSGFNDINNASWLWGVDLTLANNLDLVSWWGQVDYFTYSYAWAGDPKLIDDKLYEAISDKDLRKTQFDEDLWPTGKFFAPNRVVGGQRNIITDYVYMRLDEMLLLNAEANARLGKVVPARESLKKLFVERFETAADYAYVDNLTGQALVDEIYLQTRIEFWGEGKVYLALKRNKQKAVRGTNHLFYNNETYNYDDPAITFLIPQAEELNNPNLNK